MIQKLRKKFIVINMSLVLVVLLVVFCAVCFSSYQRQVNMSMGALRQSIMRPMDGDFPPRLEIGHEPPDRAIQIIPIFTVSVNPDGSVDAIHGKNVTVDDEDVDEVVGEVVGEVLAGSTPEGILPAYHLRYLKMDTPDGTVVGFADISSERAAMGNLLLTSLVVGLGALCAFFFVSLFLARWALRPVERAWSQQQQFVADASHELKTPLTVILANMGIILSHPEETVQRESKWLENTRTEAMRMKGLVDDLLFLAKSDAMKTPLQFAEFDLSDTIWSSILPFESLAFEQGVTLDSAIEPGIRITGNEGQVKQLAVILTDNACKYAGDGGRARVALRREGETARLSVYNTGEPIPAESIPHLFERFYRVDKSRAQKCGGYGLGLAIAKSIADAHHGKISVQSSAAHGTVFEVCLPLKAPKDRGTGRKKQRLRAKP